MYLRVSQVSPKKPASHPVKQEPLILEHCSNSAQWPHVLIQAVPKYPLSQAKINGYRLSFIKLCLNMHKTFYFSSLENICQSGEQTGECIVDEYLWFKQNLKLTKDWVFFISSETLSHIFLC